jgi:hypothetical protein
LVIVLYNFKAFPPSTQKLPSVAGVMCIFNSKHRYVYLPRPSLVLDHAVPQQDSLCSVRPSYMSGKGNNLSMHSLCHLTFLYLSVCCCHICTCLCPAHPCTDFHVMCVASLET